MEKLKVMYLINIMNLYYINHIIENNIPVLIGIYELFCKI